MSCWVLNVSKDGHLHSIYSIPNNTGRPLSWGLTTLQLSVVVSRESVTCYVKVRFFVFFYGKR